MPLLTYQSFYLIGIKGVAMTALAQCLLDAGKKVAGSDVAEEFVTQPILDRLQVKIDQSFETLIPEHVECVIYTAAHQGVDNPQVEQALTKEIPCFSHAQALGELFNQKAGIAVCGVGGKSTTSAMIAWIFEQAGHKPSFAVGVGNIPGLDKTGVWVADSPIFVAEADEYAANPTGVANGEKLIPRFSYLKPQVTVCTNLQFDHPDVYRDFSHTQAVYLEFLSQIKVGGTCIFNADDDALRTLSEQLKADRPDIVLESFGQTDAASCQLMQYQSKEGSTVSSFEYQGTRYQLTLLIPGLFNVMNALAAIVSAANQGVSVETAIQALGQFRSTMRRVEFVGEKRGVRYYDDYAHHPHEIKQVIHAFREWFPESRLVIAFQSHTFTRTKALFPEFVEAFAEASEVNMIEIFSSAREKSDTSVTSQSLCQAITQQFPAIPTRTFDSIDAMATYLRDSLTTGDVCLTVGAGDLYQVHELL